MAAEPASRPNESNPFDYFALFGLPRRFRIDRTALERQFYALSRETHPDRFAAEGGAAARLAVDRMSQLNEAYATLKDPARLREYYLFLEGYEAPKVNAASAAPAELAEAWFELQDSVMDSPETAPQRLTEFTQELQRRAVRSEAELAECERALDETRDAAGSEVAASAAPEFQAGLARLHAAIRGQSYLKSLARDVARLAARLGGGGP